MLVPLAIGVSYAFRDMVLLNPFSGGFVGLDQFRKLSGDTAFYGALRNTLLWTGASVTLQFIFGLILAWVRLETGSIYPTIALHALFNGIALIAAVAV